MDNTEYKIGDMLEAVNSATLEKWGFIILLGEEWKINSFYFKVWSQKQHKIVSFPFTTIQDYFVKIN